MNGFTVENTRNFAITGHGGSGKTSLLEQLLFKSGATSRLGRVDDGTSICDFQDDEKKRKVTIDSKVLRFETSGVNVFVVDTPGYADFYASVVGALRVVDSVLIVLDSTSGVQVGAQRIWKEAEKKGKPVIFFVNKLDKEQSNFFNVVKALRKSFGEKCIPIQVPVGKEKDFKGVADLISGSVSGTMSDEEKELFEEYKTALVENVAEADDAILEKYLGEGTLSDDEVKKGLKAAIAGRKVFPILCGSAQSAVGINELLKAIRDDFPSPDTLGEIEGLDGQKRKPAANEPMSAFAFKTMTDPFVGHITYCRVYSGTLNANSEVLNSSQDKSERLAHLYLIKGKEQITIERASAGDIVAIPKLKLTAINQTLCDSKGKIAYPPIEFPKPSISFSIHPKAKGDEEKVATGLHKLCEDDSTLVLAKNVETKEMVLSGLGDLHIEVMLARLRDKFGVDVTIGEPLVAYKETVRAMAEGHEKHKKQSGGRGQYGEVYLRLAPKPRGGGYEFKNAVVGGNIPRQYIPAIEKGVVGIMETGILAGYPVVDVEVTVYDGSYHTVDSSELSFKLAGSKAFQDAFAKASPYLLEPIVNVEVVAPEEYTGTIIGILNAKRGRMQGMDMQGGLQVIKSQVPISEMFKFSNELRSITGGSGSFSMEFSHYEEVPFNIAQKVIDKTKHARASGEMATNSTH